VLALAAAMLLLAQWMQLVEGYSPIEAGVRLVPSALAGAVSAGISPWLASRLGARNVLAGSLALAAAGMVLIYAARGDLHYPTVAVALVMVGAGTGALALGSAMIMSGTPEDRSGNAAAIEEVSYDFGNVLGVAILGSLAALLYRLGLEGDNVLDGLPAELSDAAGESVGSAVAIAAELGQPALARAAATEFTHALEATSLVGGVTLLAVAALVFLLTPRGVDVTQQHL
jgi:DHA2 family multidrug resistance protein-like MFS transporter